MIAYEEKLILLQGVESVIDVLILSQLIYWAKKMKGKEFYKSDAELAHELRISIDTLRRHKRNFKNLAFLMMKNKGIPKKTFYLISLEILEKELLKALENSIYVKSAGMLMRNCQQRSCQNDSNITVKSAGIYKEHKITHKNTTEEDAGATNSPSEFFDQIVEIYPSENITLMAFEEARVLYCTPAFQRKLVDKGLTNEDVVMGVRKYAEEIAQSSYLKPFGILKFLGFKGDLGFDPFEKYAKVEGINVGISSFKKPRNEIDQRFQEFLKERFGELLGTKSQCHLLGFSEEGEPLWELQSAVEYSFYDSEKEILQEIINQLKKELS